MSIIERNSPLNLQYKVCIVTNASSPLGVVICKTLLKANALVLGIDDQVCDHSLNAGLGTHFQFEKIQIKNDNAAERAIESAKRKFEGLGGGGRVDALIDLVEEERDGGGGGAGILECFRKLSLAIGKVMNEGNGGSIVILSTHAKGNHGSEALVELARNLSQQCGEGVRCNVVASGATSGNDPGSEEAYREAQTHMKALMKTERPANDAPLSKQVLPEHYAVGNLVLFLAGGMSENIAGRQVSLDGANCAL